MKICIKLFLILGLMIAVSPVAVNALTFNLDEVNDNDTGTLGPWASVTLTVSSFAGYDSVHFVVDPIETAFSSRDSNFGLQTFFFNESTGFGSALTVGNFVPTGWSYAYSSSNAGGGFGKFEFLASGNGFNRANPLSFDVYNNSGPAVTIADFSSVLSSEGYLFAAHIADYNGGKSAKFATDGSTNPVPEPSTLILLGAGLVGLAAYRRKKN